MALAPELWRSSDTQLLTELRRTETQSRQLDAHRYALIGELSNRGIAAEAGYASPARLLMDLLLISRAEANRRLTLADALTPRQPLTGPQLPPMLPATADALTEGELGVEHVEIIRRTLTDLPPEVTQAQRDTAEAALVDAARDVGPAGLAAMARELRARLDQDGRPPTDTELRHPRNELRYVTKANGGLAFKGELDAEGAGWLTTVIGPLAAPKPATDEGPDPRGLPERQGDALVEALRLAANCDQLPADGGERPTLLITLPLDALRDHLPSTLFNQSTPRRPDEPDAGQAQANNADIDGNEDGQRRDTSDPTGDPTVNDRLVDGPTDTCQPVGDRPDSRPADVGPERQAADSPVGGRLVDDSDDSDDSETGPTAHRSPDGVPYFDHPASLDLSNPFAVLDGVGLIDARIARRLACDCAIIPVVLGAYSEPLDIGRKTRVVPTAIRRALIVRDGGCAFPGCIAPPKYCDAHHIVEWANGGPTTLPNLTLLCGQHHRLVHHSEWAIRIATDGHPEFIPPAYIDPTRRPRRNPAHPRPG